MLCLLPSHFVGRIELLPQVIRLSTLAIGTVPFYMDVVEKQRFTIILKKRMWKIWIFDFINGMFFALTVKLVCLQTKLSLTFWSRNRFTSWGVISSVRIYRYLNSGLFMGFAPDIWKLINIDDIRDSDDDQLYYTRLYLDKRIRVSSGWIF